MIRQVEPEVMDQLDEVSAYVESDRLYVKELVRTLYIEHFKDVSLSTLDIGCGPGDLTLELSKLGLDEHVLGIDPSEAMINHCRLSDKVKFEKKSLENITGNFNRIISVFTLHHISNSLEFWKNIKILNPKEVFIFDFLRPQNYQDLEIAVSKSAPYKNNINRLLYENSLKASLSVEEIYSDLTELDLNYEIKVYDDLNSPNFILIVATNK